MAGLKAARVEAATSTTLKQALLSGVDKGKMDGKMDAAGGAAALSDR